MENFTVQEQNFLESIGKEIIFLGCKGCPESGNCKQKQERLTHDLCLEHWKEYIIKNLRESNSKDREIVCQPYYI